MSAEATSKRGITSILARGTGGYRAPELIRDIHQFTNKVDIWALGCILHELTNKSEAFKDDWDVRTYQRACSVEPIGARSLTSSLQKSETAS